MNITKTVKNIISTMDSYAEPYTIQKINSETGEIEQVVIIPACGEQGQYLPYI